MNLKALYKISYGLYVVSSKRDKEFNGQIANTVFQITAEPPRVAVSINKENLTHEFIQESKVFTVSILSKKTPMKFIGRFGFNSGRKLDKFKDVNCKVGVTGTPVVLENTVGYLEVEVTGSLDVGTHTIFVGRAVEAEIISDREPMTYAYYHEIKRGTAPKTAPTYIKDEPREHRTEMERYRCTVCGYVYDPKNGDPDSGIKPGTLFEELPDDWVCPICGAGKEAFEKERRTKMTERLQVYKCEICGNIVEVLHEGNGELVCCGQPMKLFKENTVDAALEKHVPVLEKTEEGIKVKVGSAAHPMEEKHYIEWVEVIADGKAYRQFLKPGCEPEAVFAINVHEITARSYCNLHGLWKS